METLKMGRFFEASVSKRRACIFTGCFAMFTIACLRLYVWDGRRDVLMSEGLDLHDGRVLEREWEWARNISIVYTWVNGSESGFRDQRISYGGKESGGGNLDRDNDELLYSLRSLSKYLPWHVGKVYIVTQNQIPTWLNVSNPRIQMVNHSDIIPGEFLPTYNSNVIDSYLHRIAGLTEIFLYFNDDVFVRSPLHPSDLFAPARGLKLFVEDLTIPLNHTQQTAFIDGVRDQAYWRAFFSTVRLLEETFGRASMKPLRLLQHTSHAFHRGAIERVHHLWADELQTAHRNKFREESDILFIYAYYGYLVHQGWTCCSLKQETFETEGGGDRISFLDDTASNSRAIERLRARQKPKFLNINDMMGHDATADDARAQLTDFLREEFGTEKSSFELDF
ncbi:hypothetical protein PVAG01_07884 [Phlyctema vagabunda]|uniref:Stealth protein CR2 conserved region 2 domain-containing protein n=1 Tax=Phlyctema vagabunda TaxID=108571 RepID=A0ABR4PDT6_9HELO